MTRNGRARGGAGKGEMRRRSTRLNSATAEALLDGHAADTPVTWLLAAAAAPRRAEEIAGEAAARAAFTAARPTQAPFLRPPQARRPLVSRLPPALALVVLAAGATGGVALAANAQFARAPGVVEHPAPPPAATLPLPTAPPSTAPTASATPAAPPPAAASGTRPSASGKPPSALEKPRSGSEKSPSGSEKSPSESEKSPSGSMGPSSAPRQAVQSTSPPPVATAPQARSCTATVPCGPTATPDDAPAPAAVLLAAEAAAPTTSPTAPDPQPTEQRSTAHHTYPDER